MLTSVRVYADTNTHINKANSRNRAELRNGNYKVMRTFVEGWKLCVLVCAGTCVASTAPTSTDHFDLSLGRERGLGSDSAESPDPGGGADDIIGAERHRDVAMSAREPGTGPVDLHAHHNLSNAALDRILQAETGRDESLTNILSRRAALVHNTSAPDYVELVAARFNTTHNLTQHELHDDAAPDTVLSVLAGFSDLQSVVLAGVGTLLPLLVLLLAVLSIRWAARRCGSRPRSVTSSVRTDSSDKPQHHLESRSSPVPLSPAESADSGKSPTGNGSVFTLTLKNNHLIVETEERNDISRGGRETRMKYSAEQDGGVFVVEVQQCASYRAAPPSPPQRALVHAPAPAAAPVPTGAGLATSQLSVRSPELPSYAYGAQAAYEHGPRGYPPHDAPAPAPLDLLRDTSREPLLPTPTDPDTPLVTAALLKRDSRAYCIEGCSDGPLLSDLQARQLTLHRLQHDPSPSPPAPTSPTPARPSESHTPS